MSITGTINKRLVWKYKTFLTTWLLNYTLPALTNPIKHRVYITIVTVNPPSWLSLCSDLQSRRRCCSGIGRRGSWWSSSSSRRCSGRNPDRGRQSDPSFPGCRRWLVRTLNCSMPTTQLGRISDCHVWINSSIFYSVVVWDSDIMAFQY